MARASGVFVPPSPARDAGVVTASTSDVCGIGCEAAQGSPVGIGMLVALAVAVAIAVKRLRSGPSEPHR
jgi:hypothetical protein